MCRQAPAGPAAAPAACMRHSKLIPLGLASAVLACASKLPDAEPVFAGDSALGARFALAAEQSLTPAPLLIALAYEDTRFSPRPAAPSHDGAPARYGMM